MFFRVKIGAAFFLAGMLTGSAAPLNLQGKTAPSQDGGLIAPVIIKPGEARASLATGSRWRGVKVQKINPGSRSTSKVEVNGFVFAKAADVARPTEAALPVKRLKK
jgi:hypothetical protein